MDLNLNKKIKVLNHGFVRLTEYMGSDLSIVRNARVSYDAAWRAGEDKGSDSRLINYLYKNKHNTPFEAVVFNFEVMAPIFVLRQWHRHRTQSYNELSARYKVLPNKFYLPDIEHITEQSTDNKQMRTGNIHNNANDFRNEMYAHGNNAFDVYDSLILSGCPRELARTVLPTSTYSHMFTTVNLHNLFGFLRERLHKHAQYEIRVYAKAILELIEPIVPVAVQAFKDSIKENKNYE